MPENMNQPGVHGATPVVGSCRSLDGTPASLMNPGDYPIEAICQECGRPIRTERFYMADWDHIERFTSPEVA